jgi:Fe-S cluster biogenesis protein NfuA
MFKRFTDQPGAEPGPETTAHPAAGAPAPAPDPDVQYRVQAIIDELRPFIQADGGDCELIKVEDGVVYVRLVGSCVGCPSSLATLKGGLEMRIREEVPEVTSVEMI